MATRPSVVSEPSNTQRQETSAIPLRPGPVQRSESAPRTHPPAACTQAGDVIEAILGLCAPWQEAHRGSRQDFASTWGLTLEDLADLHGRIEAILPHISKLVAVAHHHPDAQAAGCPQTWSKMDRRDFQLKAPMLVLEKIVPAASLTPLGTHHCSVRALHIALAGSDAPLGDDDRGAGLAYIGGGFALSNTDLNAPMPSAPAPGTKQDPPRIPDDRLLAEQKHGRFKCDRCGKDQLRSTDGTWISDDTRLMVAQNRPQAYLDGTNMGWHCEICWIRHLEDKGIPAPTGATVADKVKEYEHW
ncbi:unnamed protein product, partial [Prorocentrum cordatum]